MSLYVNVISNGTVYPKVMEKHLNEELPFMATENIMMYCVKKGGDRQALHEAIRQLSVAVAKNIKLYGGNNNLLELILNDDRFNITKEELDSILHVRNFIGMAPQQTDEFVNNEIKPVLDANKDMLGFEAKINV